MTDLEAFVTWAGLPPGAAILMSGWATRALLIGGATVAMAVLNGTEIHFAIDPERRRSVITRRRAREFLAPIIAERAFLTTRVVLGDERAAKFVKRIGFEPTGSDQVCNHFMLCGAPFSRHKE